MNALHRGNCAGAEHKNTDRFQIQVWGSLTKFAATLKAGKPVIVEGKIKPETYTADGVEHKTFSIKADYFRKIDYSAPSEAARASRPSEPRRPNSISATWRRLFGAAFSVPTESASNSA